MTDDVPQDQENSLLDNPREHDYMNHYQSGGKYLMVLAPAVATLSFDLTDPDGRTAHRNALQGEAFRSVMWELDQWLRGQVKYGLSDDFLHSIDRKPGSITTEQEDIVDDSLNAVRLALAGICDDHGIRLDEE